MTGMQYEALKQIREILLKGDWKYYSKVVDELLNAPTRTQGAEHCINCGMATDPKCACSRGRELAASLLAYDAQPVATRSAGSHSALTDEQIYEIAFKYCYATTAANGFVFDRARGHMIAFARALLQANGATK
jgi:hypothetical protein